MSTASIIALSAIVSLFIILLLGSGGVIIWLTIRLERAMTRAETSIMGMLAESADADVSHREAQLELLNQQATNIATHQSQLSSILTTLRESIGAKIDSINGKELSAAAYQSTIAAKRIENAGLCIAELAKALLSEESIAAARTNGNGSGRPAGPTTGIDSDGYALNPDASHWSTTGRVAAGDEYSIREEAADNQTEFS